MATAQALAIRKAKQQDELNARVAALEAKIDRLTELIEALHKQQAEPAKAKRA